MWLMMQEESYHAIADVDECSLYSPCVNADCINNAGSFVCMTCHYGFNKSLSDLTGPCCKFKC